MQIDLVSLLVDDYDRAIGFFVDVLGFTLVEDTPATSGDGRAKRWVVVRPPGAQTGLVLARADGELQQRLVGQQHGGRVGFFLRVADFEDTLARLVDAGAAIVSPPRDEPYGRVAIFADLFGNRWDLLGPRPPVPSTT